MASRRVKRSEPVFQAEIPEVLFSVDSILLDLLKSQFREISAAPPWAFLDTDSLAFIRTDRRGSFIGMHFLLNHPETPAQVIRDILAHELLHLRFPPKKIGRRLVAHHEAFTKAQKDIIPTFSQSYAWCLLNFATVIHIDKKSEKTLIKARSPNDWRFIHRLLLEEIIDITSPSPPSSVQMNLF